MCSKSVIAALPVLLLVVGCGGGSRTTTPPVAGRSNLARFDVDATTGRVTISQTSGRAAFEGGAVSFSSSALIVVPGDAGQRVIRVKATNNSGQTWGSSPVRMVVSDLRNAGGNDVRIRVRVRTRAGSGSYSEADGFGLSASFASPAGIALGAGPTAGSVFVADLNGPTLRRMLPDGMVSTVAGLAGSPAPDDGTGSSARFMGPHGEATDSYGNVYVADDYGQTIRRITPLGRVTTIAGTGVAGELDGGGATAKFASPSGMAATPDGNRIYVCDRTGATIRLIEYVGSGSRELASSYVVTTIAGSAYAAGWADGPGSVARFAGPTGVCAMQREEGGLIALIADGNALRALSYRGGNEPRQAGNYEVVTLAGSAVAGYADGDGCLARFNGARDVACVATEGDSTTAYVSDLYNCRIREVSIPSGDLHSGGAVGAPTETVRLITYDDEVPNQSAWRRSMAPTGDSYET